MPLRGTIIPVDGIINMLGPLSCQNDVENKVESPWKSMEEIVLKESGKPGITPTPVILFWVLPGFKWQVELLLEAENERKSLSGCIYPCVYTHILYSPSQEWQCYTGNGGYFWMEELRGLKPELGEMGFSLAFLSFVPTQHYLPDELK